MRYTVSLRRGCALLSGIARDLDVGVRSYCGKARSGKKA